MNRTLLVARTLGLLGLWLLCSASPAAEAAQDEFLPPAQAFEYVVQADQNALIVAYNIREGYYLYRKRIAFTTDTPGVTLGEAAFPKGLPHQDDYFGEQEVYRGGATFRVPYTVANGAPAAIDLKLKLQGCADAGLCYPPQIWTAHVALPAPRLAAAGAGLLAKLGAGGKNDDFLPPEQAFRVTATPNGDSRVHVNFVVADGYYLYRDRINVSAQTDGIGLGAAEFPPGLSHQDDYFGEQTIYRGAFTVAVPYARSGPATGPVGIKVVYQGCADAGLCYPPQTRVLTVATPSGGTTDGTTGGSAGKVSEQDRLARLIKRGNLMLVIGAFFGFGLLLSFTPCVLPMVPILAGIIAGDGEKTTPGRGFALSLAYVLGMAATYTAAGIAFAAAGQQAQAVFQQPWILVLFAALFVLLALAMFGAYELQMPSGLQTHFASVSNRIRGGKFISTAIMGALSSLVVTACVAPPLVAALAVIGQAGDIARGGLALAALSFGMGTPLLFVGASAGKLLPKAGPWMETVKAIFGVVFLGVAAWMLDRVLGPRLMLAVWALVAFASVWVLLTVGLRGGRRGLGRSLAGGVATLAGLTLLVGAAAGGTDPLHPFAGTALFGAAPGPQSLAFRSIGSVADLDRELAAARASGKRTMLDFYADWCVSCKEMEARTFRDPSVRAALQNYVVLKADVTGNSPTDQALLKRFGIFGPPTTAFFATDGHEKIDYRLVGFVAAESFRHHLVGFEGTP